MGAKRRYAEHPENPSGWDDENTFIQSLEPNDATWHYDDSIDTQTRCDSQSGESSPEPTAPIDGSDKPAAVRNMDRPDYSVSAGLQFTGNDSGEEADPGDMALSVDRDGIDSPDIIDCDISDLVELELPEEDPYSAFPAPSWDFVDEDDAFSEHLEWDADAETWEPQESVPFFTPEGVDDIPPDLEEARSDGQPDWSRRKKIAHEEHVRRVAIQIAHDVNWSDAGMEMIAWAIRSYRSFGRVAQDLRNFILETQASVRELQLVTELRSVWVDGGYCRGRAYQKGYRGTSLVDYYGNLNWWFALRIYRELSLEDVEEARLFIDESFEAWNGLIFRFMDKDLDLLDSRTAERRASMHFYWYLHYLLDQLFSIPGDHRIRPILDFSFFPDEWKDEETPVMSGPVIYRLEES